MAEKLVVIGGTAAGLSAASKARKANPTMDILVFEKSGYTSYGSCGLPYFVSDMIKSPEELVTLTPSALLEKRNIKALVHHEVINIDRTNKKVQVKNLLIGEVFEASYDKLVIATGARPIVPNIQNALDEKGQLTPGVFTLRQVEDGIRLKQAVFEKAKIAIVGGGNIGLEVAEQLSQMDNKGITLIESKERLLPQFPLEYGQRVVQALQKQGVTLLLGHRAQEILVNKGEITGLVTNLGTRVEADIVLLGTGVKPQAALAQKAGLKLDEFGAIWVNEYQQTSDNSIWACGDCTAAVHLITNKPYYMPLGTHANKQGRIAGENLAGGQKKKKKILGSQGTKVYGIYLAGTGLSLHQALAENLDAHQVTITNKDKAGYYPGGEENTLTLVFEKPAGRILGAQGMGGFSVVGRINVLATAITAGLGLDELNQVDYIYTPSVAPVYDPILIAAENGLKRL